jgi:hypothetical protein
MSGRAPLLLVLGYIVLIPLGIIRWPLRALSSVH